MIQYIENKKYVHEELQLGQVRSQCSPFLRNEEKTETYRHHQQKALEAKLMPQPIIKLQLIL